MTSFDVREHSRQLALETVNFLGATDAFFRASRQFPPSPFRIANYDQSVGAIMAESRREINECIRALGGLVINVTDSEGDILQRLAVDSWLGYDADNDENLVWQIRGAPPGAILSVDRSVIDELWNSFA
jgi:hypothetical protein